MDPLAPRPGRLGLSEQIRLQSAQRATGLAMERLARLAGTAQRG